MKKFYSALIKKIRKRTISEIIETIIEHKIFKPAVISIITSFVIFNGLSYLKTHLEKNNYYKQSQLEQKIKVTIPDNYNLRIDQNQTLQHQIKVGDTLLKILLDIGTSESDTFEILSEIRKVYDPKSIKVGDKITIKYNNQASSDIKKIESKNGENLLKKEEVRKKAVIESININPSPETEIIVSSRKSVDNIYHYQAKKISKTLTKQILKYAVTIKDGLYNDGIAAGISPNIMINMINLYSFDIDFQRDIRDNDKFEILFESFYDEKGNHIKDGNVLFTSLNLQQKRTIDMYLSNIGGKNEYFDSKGNSVKKSLLKTPINGARISSGFGMRRHPILGYSKMHKGIDFAAPTGTPIFAAGAGTITYYGIKGGYGNFVQIRHNKDYSTGYGHASRLIKKLKVGSKVQQGEIVAYVGSTGRSTGPHLHYEIIIKGQQVNPANVKSTSGIKLTGAILKKFMAGKSEIDKYLRTIPNQSRF